MYKLQTQNSYNTNKLSSECYMNDINNNYIKHIPKNKDENLREKLIVRLKIYPRMVQKI